MTCDIHFTDTTHCPERVFTTHNSTPHGRKIGKENMTAKGTRNSELNILVNIQILRYTSDELNISIHLNCFLVSLYFLEIHVQGLGAIW